MKSNRWLIYACKDDPPLVFPGSKSPLLSLDQFLWIILQHLLILCSNQLCLCWWYCLPRLFLAFSECILLKCSLPQQKLIYWSLFITNVIVICHFDDSCLGLCLLKCILWHHTQNQDDYILEHQNYIVSLSELLKIFVGNIHFCATFILPPGIKFQHVAS
jgi:hypothetical protein